jgi:NAD(P)-dependent dehydrogenase (short-subunit alcohol dehydrogenase family)
VLLRGQVAWVTGAGTGFGAAVARRLAQDGARVAVHPFPILRAGGGGAVIR